MPMSGSGIRAPSSPEPGIDEKLMKVLIVDDQEANLKLLRAVLERRHYSVREAPDGVVALALCERESVDAIISDILMPNMDGYRLCQEVRRDERLRGIPFIFYSSTYTSEADEKLSYELGGSKYLRKPATPDEIVEALDVAISRGPRVERHPALALTEIEKTKKYSVRLVAKLEEQNIELAAALAGQKAAVKAREELEAQLIESQKLELLGTFAAGIAHDFNNYLTAILGHLEIVRESTSTNQDGMASLDAISNAGENARKLIVQILDFSRSRSTGRRRLPILKFIEESSALVRTMLPSRISLVKNFSADVPDVFADPVQIQQILLNLAANASYAIGGSAGTIEIALDHVVLSSNHGLTNASLEPGSYAHVTFSDTGQGMDSGTLEHVFEPFYTTKPTGEGTGLGLSMTKGIMVTHEGAIFARSEVGKGTTFELYLPEAS